MNKFLFGLFVVTFVALFCFPSCKPNNTPTPLPTYQPDSSWWNIDTQKFATYYNYVSGAQGHTILSGAAYNGNSSFSITFNLPYVPAQGNYLLNCNNTTSTAACMEITYKGFRYRAGQSPSTYLQADSARQRAVINLGATWFYNTINPDDSVVVLGSFHQPQ